jgi:tetratricopeptide (TPR) repeat protein
MNAQTTHSGRVHGILVLPCFAAVAALIGCAGVGVPTPEIPLLAAPLAKLSSAKLPKPPEEGITAKKQRRKEAAVQRFEQGRDFAEYKAAMFCREQGDDAACINGLKKLLKRSPGHRQARLTLADMLLEEKKPAEAIEHLQNVLEKDPLDAQAQHAMGLALDTKGDEHGALAYYERAAVLEPENEVYRSSHQAALAASRTAGPSSDGRPLPPPPGVPIPERVNRQDASAASLSKSASAAPDAPETAAVPQHGPASGPSTLAGQSNPMRRLPSFDASPSAMPDDGATAPTAEEQTDKAGGAGYSKPGEPSGNAATANRAEPATYAGPIGRDASATRGTPRRVSGPSRVEAVDARDLLEQGKEALSRGQTATAMTHFRNAIAAKPDDPQVPTAAATAALRYNQPGAAIELIEPAVKVFPKSAALHRILAASYYRRGDYAASQVAAQQALSLDNSSALSYFLVGSALARLGQPEAAETHLRQAQRLDPRYGDAR